MANIENEKIVIRKMIHLYCAKHHGAEPCDDCRELITYAEHRMDRCGYGKKKPRCKKCTTHCYAKSEREKIRTIMREIGPRILFHCPIRTIRYFICRRK